MFIIILGTDGSGKSSVVTKISKQNDVWSFHFCPTGKYNNPKREKNVLPHSYPDYSYTTSFLKLIYLVFQFWLGYFKYIYPQKRKKYIIGDRYFYDLLFDPRRYRIRNFKGLIRFLSGLIPNPDIVFYLYGDSEILYQRKFELSEKILRMQQKLILSESQKHKKWIGIDITNKNISSVVAIIERKMAQMSSICKG